MEVKQRIAQCLEIQRKHNQKIVFAIITMFLLIQASAVFLTIFTFGLSALKGIGSILSFAVLILMFAGFFALHSGFCIILLKLVKNERVILGDMFTPFRTFGKTIKLGRFFIVTTLLFSFIASMILLFNIDINSLLTSFESGKTNIQLNATIYGFFALTLLANIPFIFLPFFAFDMNEKSPKEIKQFSLSLFKTSFKDLFLSWVMFAGKKFALFAVLFVLSLLNIKTISSIATFISSILIFLVYSSLMLMTACVFQDYVQPEPEIEVLEIEDRTDSYTEAIKEEQDS